MVNTNDIPRMNELREILKGLFVAFNKQGMKDSEKSDILNLWMEDLADYTPEQIRNAAIQYRRTEKFFPHVSDIRGIIEAGKSVALTVGGSWFNENRFSLERIRHQKRNPDGEWVDDLEEWAKFCRSASQKMDDAQIEAVNQYREAHNMPLMRRVYIKSDLTFGTATDWRDYEAKQSAQNFSGLPHQIETAIEKAHVRRV